MMNVVYLHAHDAGTFVQPYGFPVETPNLMKFAREGVLFRQAFACAPTCGPSRAALTSGQYPHKIGMFGLPGHQGWLMDDYQKHMAQQFRNWGYETVLAGVQHEAPHADFSCLGYERVLESEEPVRAQAGECYPETIDKVERYLAHQDGSRPFFLSVGIDEPHRDNIPREELNLKGQADRFTKTRYYDPKRLDSRYTQVPPWLPDIPEIRADMEAYREGVKLMDEYMGRVLYALKHLGLEKNTVVILTTDHGIEFPGGKKTLHDPGTKVMLMMRGPAAGPLSGGKVFESLVSHLDIYPTLCELLSLQVPHELDGKSLLPLLLGDIDEVHEAVFTEQTYHGQLEASRAVRTQRYKYIRHHESKGPIMRHDGPSTAHMEGFGFYDRERGKEEFYDLYLDPNEACNRSEDPNLQSEKAELARMLDDWMQATNDPFPTGKFPDPPNGW
jgi:arylsulfatase A-like enzyme